MKSATGFLFQPFAGIINNFNVGIQIDADGARLFNDFGAPLWIGDQVDTGIFLNRVQGTLVFAPGTHAIFNGVLIRGGRGNLIQGSNTQVGDMPGKVNGGPTECCAEVIASDSDGIRTDGGSIGNHLYQIDVTKGGSDGAGVHISGNSIGNFLTESGITNAGTGIRIEAGSMANFMLNSDVTGDTLDLFDGNPNCSTNWWQVGMFNTANPSSCIH